uniref:Uncharacterized protein n=1 Tax=Anguilla anguilla TaxID=7936 RepID=A0A0E9TPM3_ANGAN
MCFQCVCDKDFSFGIHILCFDHEHNTGTLNGEQCL